MHRIRKVRGLLQDRAMDQRRAGFGPPNLRSRGLQADQGSATPQLRARSGGPNPLELT